jgi:tripartite-type tricarboxylate transporter receptor subunit TctC
MPETDREDRNVRTLLRTFAAATIISLICGAARLAGADPFPGGTIEITVLFPAGSSADVSARLLADGMSRRLGVNVIVVDRPGAGGALGYKYVAGQTPDGRSLVWNSNSISTTHYSGTLPITYEAFEPVARVLVESPVVAVNGPSKWTSLAELIAAARAAQNRDGGQFRHR